MGRSWVHTGFAQQIVFGPGTVAQLGELTRNIGRRRALLITTQGRLDSDDGSRVVRALGRALTSTFAETRSHVPVPIVQAAVQQARAEAIDLVVSFGGGSCADLGKAVCFFLEQEQGMPGTSHIDRPAIAHLSVPTTYSGAELTPFFGMTDPATHQKSGAGGPTTAPVVAVYDPELTRSTPPRVSAETGMNALAHCVEAVWSPRRSPEAEAIAVAGLHRIFHVLPLVVDEPDDLDLRTGMLEGAVLAGRCLHNAAMGVHHGLCQLLGGRTGIAHGLANAIVLPHAIRFNAGAVPDAVERIGAAIGAPADPASAIAGLLDRLGLPSRLSECGVTDDDLDAVARMAPGNRTVAGNPRPVGEDDARAILEAAA